MKDKYAYSALCQMTPAEVAELREQLRVEYAKLLQEHHQNCAAILFYQDQISHMAPA